MDKAPGIYGFFDDNRYLSNFWYAKFEAYNIEWDTNEHFFQAMKGRTRKDFLYVAEANGPAEAKKRGREIQLCGNWEFIKLNVMSTGIKFKFDQNPELQEKLLSTRGLYLEETNHWGDKYWGVCNGVGQNKLGHILMAYREAKFFEKLIYD